MKIIAKIVQCLFVMNTIRSKVTTGDSICMSNKQIRISVRLVNIPDPSNRIFGTSK